MTIARRQVELLEKNRPRQERAKRTYEAILSAAAELLIEVGVERISTNLIAERAGITVPALYRYFPNKYAVMHALGAVLMDHQNSAFQEWVGNYVTSDRPQDLLTNVYDVLKLIYDLTHQMNGGIQISLALRAVEPLQELRLTSHRMMAEQFALCVSQLLQRPLDPDLAVKARLGVDMGYAVVELALEDDTLPAEEILREGALMLEGYLRATLQLPE